MNCMFWNLKMKNLNELITKAVEEYEIHLLVLAELNSYFEKELIARLVTYDNRFHEFILVGCDRIKVFTNIGNRNIRRITDSSHFAIIEFKEIIGPSLIFGMVHFESQMYSDEGNFQAEAMKLRGEIELAEEMLKSDKSVVVGDFNMNPFDKGMLSTLGMHAFPTKLEASKKSRKIKQVEHKMFYNPMWKVFSENPDLHYGSYYYSSTKTYMLYWNVLDQVIIRPSLIERFGNLKILNQINTTSIVSNTSIKKPNASDHLPLVFTIQNE